MSVTGERDRGVMQAVIVPHLRSEDASQARRIAGMTR
jgi:hypothetical protein